jgi:hypothetical protein
MHIQATFAEEAADQCGCPRIALENHPRESVQSATIRGLFLESALEIALMLCGVLGR